jgi:2Fe-2S iron-sulfur cluster binding domain
LNASRIHQRTAKRIRLQRARRTPDSRRDGRRYILRDYKMNLEDYKDIFEPFEKLVEIEICGETREVPENNSLLRCFQYLSLETISYGDFCWNGDCLNCQVWLKQGDKEKAVLSCRTKVEEGMKIVKLNGEINL